MAEHALETLNEYEHAANRLLAVSDKGAVERAARVLALYVGHYQLRHGPISTAALAAFDNASPTEAEIADRAEGMRVLAAALTIAGVAASDSEEDASGEKG